MRHWMRHCLCGTAAALAGLWLAAVPATGQTTPTTHHAAGTWTPARTPDGQPDIQGMWDGGAGFQEQGVVSLPQAAPGPAGVDCRALGLINTVCAGYPSLWSGVIDGKANFGRGRPNEPTAPSRPRGFIDVPDGKLPWTPWGAAKRADLMQHLYNPPTLEHVDPNARCMPTWRPLGERGLTQQFLQIPGYVVILIESNHVTRVIPVDGRPHLSPDIRLFQGDSVGRWEGTTLVVDTTNFTGGGWFDMFGSAPQSDALHVIERFTVVDADTMDYVVTIDDPKLFTKPWSFAGSLRRAATAEAQGVQTTEILEHACAEGSRALENILERPDRPLPPEKLLPR